MRLYIAVPPPRSHARYHISSIGKGEEYADTDMFVETQLGQLCKQMYI